MFGGLGLWFLLGLAVRDRKGRAFLVAGSGPSLSAGLLDEKRICLLWRSGSGSISYAQ